MRRPPYPEFYVVGAAKAGTTSLWNYLSDHPQIFLGPVKEPNFLAVGSHEPNAVGPKPEPDLHALLHVDTVCSEAEYLDLFADAPADQVRGEASVRYLYHPDAVANLAAARPDARIVVALREPFDRLRSHYVMNRMWDIEPLDLEAALDAEDRRVSDGWGWDWHYVRLGRYGEQLERYFEHFDREQVLVISYDDFRRDPTGVVQRICGHIGVDADFIPQTNIRAKQAYVPRSRVLDRLRRADGPLKVVRAGLPPSIRRHAGGMLRRVNHADPVGDDTVLRARVREQLAEDRRLLEELVGPEPWTSRR